jgi:hypothetical protein
VRRLLASVLLLAACREAPAPAPAESPSASAIAATTPPAEPSPKPAGTEASSKPARAELPVPFESEGACPFECCVYRTWTVRAATAVRASRDASAATAYTLEPGDKVDAVTGVVVVSRPGRARASREVKVEGLGELRKGDEVSVLHPLGEGYWLVWREGKKGSAQIGEKSPRPGPWDPELNPITKPEFTWWIRLEDGQGRTGWTNAPENFGSKDRCG